MVWLTAVFAVHCSECSVVFVFLQHACCGKDSSSSQGESVSILSLRVRRLLVRNSGLSHGSKLVYVTTETLFPQVFHEAWDTLSFLPSESELIAGLGAGPGLQKPSLSASPMSLHIVLEAGCGEVTAATSALTTNSHKSRAFLPKPLCAEGQGFISGCVTSFLSVYGLSSIAFQRVFHSN